MKRLYISLFIIALVVALGIFSLYFIYSENRRLQNAIESVESEQGIETVSVLQREFDTYRKRLGLVVSDEKLFEMEKTVARIASMSQTGNDELSAECKELKIMTEEILKAYLPTPERLL